MNMNENTTKDFTWARFFLDVLTDIIVVVTLVLLFRHFLYTPFQVDGPSMCDTFNTYDDECFNGPGEYVIASRLSTWDVFGWSPAKIQRGDVIIFQPPNGEPGDYFIKRVIGLPGDTVEIKDGWVYVNDEKIDEPYLNEDNYGNTQPYRVSSETYEVPDGEYFVMGDNRTKSSDSRRCFQNSGCAGDDSSHFLDFDLIKGEVKLVIFPFTHFRLVHGVDYELIAN